MIYDTETMVAPCNTGRRNVLHKNVSVMSTGPRFDTSAVSAVNMEPVAAAKPSAGQVNCDALTSYYREMSSFPRITVEEEIELAHRVQQGDEVARERMITANLRLVVKLAREFEGFGLPLLDLINEGNIGLMKAVDRFDPTRGARLACYACYWIKQVMRRALANHARTIRLPVHVHEKLLHIGRVAHRLQEALGRAATDEEISDEAGISPNRVRRFREAAHPAASLDQASADEDSRGLAETLPDISATAPDTALLLATDLELMRQHLPALDRREQRILVLRFGLDGRGEKTLEEIGDEIGLTRERVRQIQELALKKLRRRMDRHDGTAVAA